MRGKGSWAYASNVRTTWDLQGWACCHTHTHTQTHTPSAYSPAPHPSHLIETLPYTLSHLLSRAPVLALMGFLPQSSTYSSLLYMHQLPQHPPLCPLPGPRMSPHHAQPEWLILSGCLARPRHCLHLKSLPQLHSQPGSGRHICLPLCALGDILRGWRPPGT